MSFPYMNPNNVSLGLETFTNVAAAGDLRQLFQVQKASTITGGYSWSNATVGAGTVVVAIVDLGTAGTAVAATIGSVGTVTAYTADKPNAMSMVAANQDVAAGTYVGVQIKGDGTLDPVLGVSCDYVLGTPGALG